MSIRAAVLFVGVAAANWLTPPAHATDGYAITRWTIDGGGGSAVQGEGYQLGGTIGQPDAGTLSTSTYVLRGGFWPGVSGALSCIGDCNANRAVTIDEILLGVNIALGQRPVEDCVAADRDGSGSVTIDEILTAVHAALQGCP